MTTVVNDIGPKVPPVEVDFWWNENGPPELYTFDGDSYPYVSPEPASRYTMSTTFINEPVQFFANPPIEEAVIDSLKRPAEEKPLNGGKWQTLPWRSTPGYIFFSGGESYWYACLETEFGGAYWSEEFPLNTVSLQMHDGTLLEGFRTYFALWACLDPVHHSGYLAKFEVEKEGSRLLTLWLELYEHGEPTKVIAKVKKLNPETEGTTFKLEVLEGKLKVFQNNVVKLEATDTKYTKGFVGIEGLGENAWGFNNFTAQRHALIPHVETPPNVTIVEYLWDFGDGSFGYGPSVTHEYKLAEPNLKVKLTVVDSRGLEWSNAKPLNLVPHARGYISSQFSGAPR